MGMRNFSVVLIYEVDDDFYHCIFLFCAAFGNYEGKVREGVVGNALVAVAE